MAKVQMRLIDAYRQGLVTKDAFQSRMPKGPRADVEKAHNLLVEVEI